MPPAAEFMHAASRIQQELQTSMEAEAARAGEYSGSDASQVLHTAAYTYVIELTHPELQGIHTFLRGFFSADPLALSRMPDTLRDSFRSFLMEEQYPKLVGGTLAGGEPAWWIELSEQEYMRFTEESVVYGTADDQRVNRQFEDGFRRFLLLSLNIARDAHIPAAGSVFR